MTTGRSGTGEFLKCRQERDRKERVTKEVKEVGRKEVGKEEKEVGRKTMKKQDKEGREIIQDISKSCLRNKRRKEKGKDWKKLERERQ